MHLLEQTTLAIIEFIRWCCKNQLPPSPFYRPILNHPHGSHTPIRSRCPNHLNLSCLTTSATFCTPRGLYRSTLRLLSFSDIISPSSFPSFPNFAALLSSSTRFQSYMPIHSGHKPLIFFPLCGMIHLELWGYKISPWILPKLWLLLLPLHLLPHQVCCPNKQNLETHSDSTLSSITTSLSKTD